MPSKSNVSASDFYRVAACYACRAHDIVLPTPVRLSVCLSVCLSVHAGIVSKRTHNCTFVDRLAVASLISEFRRSYKNPMGTLKYTGWEKFAIFATEVSE